MAMILDDLKGIIWGRRNIAVKFKSASGFDRQGQAESDRFVDHWISENHHLEVTTTHYPIENGSAISDNAYMEPRKLKLIGYISNIEAIPYTLGLFNYQSLQKIKSGWATLEAAAEDLTPLNVATTVGYYGNMLITDLSTTLDKTTGTNVLFTLEMTELKMVSSARTQGLTPDKLADGPAKNMQDPVNGGTQQSKPVSFAAVLTRGLF